MTTAEFNNLPREEKAILVAKDILEQIKIGRYIPNSGIYIKDLRSTEIFSIDSEILSMMYHLKLWLNVIILKISMKIPMIG